MCDDTNFIGKYWDELDKKIEKEEAKATIGALISLSILLTGFCGGVIYSDKKDRQDDYTFIVDEDDVTAISDSYIIKPSIFTSRDNNIIVLSNGMEFEVPNDKQAYFVKDVKSEEDVEKYIYSLVGENANITYYNYNEKQDVKSKTRTR